MKLLTTTVNLKAELRLRRKKAMSEAEILAQICAFLDRDEAQRQRIRRGLSDADSIGEHNFDPDFLDASAIFHIDQIKSLCIDFRLRFLDSSYYKDAIPEEAVSKIRRLENLHQTKLGGFHVAAPSKAFRLKNYDDPMLFAPIGNGYFHLIHQWGNDMKVWRKWLAWPFRNLATFLVFSIAVSAIITFLTPTTKLSQTVPMAGAIIFLFAFKSVFAVSFYGFSMLGKKLSCSVWDSPYFNN